MFHNCEDTYVEYRIKLDNIKLYVSTQLCNTRKYIERGYGLYIMEAMAYYVYLLTAVIVLINVTMTTNQET